MTRIITIGTTTLDLDGLAFIKEENKTSCQLWFKGNPTGVMVQKSYDEVVSLWKGEKAKTGKGK